VPEVLLGLTNVFSHGRGFTSFAPVTVPVAGANLAYTQGGSYWARVQSLTFLYTSSNQVATRTVVLQVLDGTGIPIAEIPAASTQVASLANRYTYLPQINQPQTIVGTRILAPFPNVWLQPGFQITTAITNIASNDTLTQIRLYLEQIDTSDAGYRLGVYAEDEAANLLARAG
jgi:hypothetical protein